MGSAKEIPDWDEESIYKESKELWNQELNKIQEAVKRYNSFNGYSIGLLDAIKAIGEEYQTAHTASVEKQREKLADLNGKSKMTTATLLTLTLSYLSALKTKFILSVCSRTQRQKNFCLSTELKHRSRQVALLTKTVTCS